MENVFDALCSALNEPEIKDLFSASEGVDLMVLIMKSVLRSIPFLLTLTRNFREKRQSRLRSIKTLDYAMSGTAGTAICEAFVDALGLKTLFSAFMGKVSHLTTIDLPL
jgi:beta-catenin-like protein 1